MKPVILHSLGILVCIGLFVVPILAEEGTKL